MAHRVMDKTGLRALLLGALLLSGAAHAQLYTRFGPANGLLVGQTTTPQTTAAAWANIQALLTGTCNSSTVVNGAGGCVTPAAGTITGITFAVPTGLSISGSPCTSGSCSFTLSTALSGVLKGTGSGFTTAASSDITALLNPTAHGVLFGEGTAAFTSLTMAADTFLQGTGTSSDPQAGSLTNCGDSSHALSYSTSTHTFGCQAISTGSTSPAAAYGYISTSPSSCSVNTSYDHSNIASCARLATGSYDVTLTTFGADNPICVTTIVPTAPVSTGSTNVQNNGTGVTNVGVTNSAGTFVDADFMIRCD